MVRMTRRVAGWLMVAGLLVAAAAPAGAADKKSKDSGTELRTAEGLHFELPPDWPIEKRGGVVAPIPVEEYLSRKFGAMENRMRAIEQQAGALDVRLRVLEEQLKKQQSGLKSGATP